MSDVTNSRNCISSNELLGSAQLRAKSVQLFMDGNQKMAPNVQKARNNFYSRKYSLSSVSI